MRDFPVFTTQAGVASITLNQIPYKKEAYIRIQDAFKLEILLRECGDFCRAAGAVHVFFTGYDQHTYPPYTQLWKMMRIREGLPDTDLSLFPLQPETLDTWRQIYNENMRNVPLASMMTHIEAKKLLDTGNGYFVHQNGELFGIGVASEETIRTVVSLCPGSGQEILLALNHALTGERMIVEVASENHRAIGLYKRMGFVATEVLAQWYQLI